MGLTNRISKIGDLDTLISIYKMTQSTTSTGGYKLTRGTEYQVWARRIYNTRGLKEESSGGMELSHKQVAWEFPFEAAVISPALTTKDEIVVGGLTYDIIAINIIGRDQYYQIITELRA